MTVALPAEQLDQLVEEVANRLASRRLWRVKQLITTPKRVGRLPFGDATLWRLRESGQFPSPARYLGSVPYWTELQVQEFERRMLDGEVTMPRVNRNGGE